MDLLQTVRKEGSRGGVDFSWAAVKTDQHRENYLGHSLMAPVGRWQKGRDLAWYAKGDGADELMAREGRAEEVRRVRELEDDAMARALGLPGRERGAEGELLGGEVRGGLGEALADEGREVGRKGTRPAGDERRRSRDGRRDDDGRAAKRRRSSRPRSRDGDGWREGARRHRPRSRSREHRRRHSRDGRREERRPGLYGAGSRERERERGARRRRSRSPRARSGGRRERDD